MENETAPENRSCFAIHTVNPNAHRASDSA